MAVVAPAITVETEDEFRTAVERIKPFAQRVHLDISDGEFAPVFLLDISKMYWPKEWIVDIHAMVTRPAEYIDRLIALKPNMITIHAEAQGDLLAIINKIKQSGIKAGLALLKTTVPSTVADLIKAVDHVLIFSGDLGHYGGVASMMQLEKARLVRAINPNVELSWDGGANVENAFTLSQGGIDVLNTGGAIGKAANPQDIYNKMVMETNKQGVI